MSRDILIRNLALHGVGVLLLTCYGIAACPFLEQFSIFELALVLAVGLSFGWISKTILVRRIDRSTSARSFTRWSSFFSCSCAARRSPREGTAATCG